MKRSEVERILRTKGWRKTISTPEHVVDYQRSKPYQRIILYPDEVRELTLADLEERIGEPLK